MTRGSGRDGRGGSSRRGPGPANPRRRTATTTRVVASTEHARAQRYLKWLADQIAPDKQVETVMKDVFLAANKISDFCEKLNTEQKAASIILDLALATLLKARMLALESEQWKAEAILVPEVGALWGPKFFADADEPEIEVIVFNGQGYHAASPEEAEAVRSFLQKVEGASRPDPKTKPN